MSAAKVSEPIDALIAEAKRLIERGANHAETGCDPLSNWPLNRDTQMNYLWGVLALGVAVGYEIGTGKPKLTGDRSISSLWMQMAFATRREVCGERP